MREAEKTASREKLFHHNPFGRRSKKTTLWAGAKAIPNIPLYREIRPMMNLMKFH
jgi:hypothetical protein